MAQEIKCRASAARSAQRINSLRDGCKSPRSKVATARVWTRDINDTQLGTVFMSGEVTMPADWLWAVERRRTLNARWNRANDGSCGVAALRHVQSTEQASDVENESGRPSGVYRRVFDGIPVTLQRRYNSGGIYALCYRCGRSI